MKLRHLTVALALTGLLAACDQQLPISNDTDKAADTNTAAKPVDNSAVVATVNGKPITADMLDHYQQQRQSRMPGAAQNRKALLEELISLELASQDGIKQGVDKQPDVYAQIEQQRRAVIASAAFQQQMAKQPITDEELKALYDEKTEAGNEYKARHILVKSKEEAEKLIAELDKGADFAELAKQHSTGPSGKSGGDLGWFAPKSMVKPFADAVTGMEKGSYTHEPVKTQFGWHIIKLEDTRNTTPPPFEQVKPQLEMMVRNQRVQDYIQKLRQEATITIDESAFPAQAQADDHSGHEHDQQATETPAAKTASGDTAAGENTADDTAKP